MKKFIQEIKSRYLLWKLTREADKLLDQLTAAQQKTRKNPSKPEACL